VEKVNGKTIVQIGCFGDCNIPTFKLNHHYLFLPSENFFKEKLEKYPDIIVVNPDGEFHIWKD